ncbi:PAX3- and PAX7-binding protein 1 [Tripterygium wilfordii]|uniref:PAX3- and PAX7-binding protein 1 n=1 Tax=Tripterygium wilfordii TaxID=458696 RepID=A0A7J7CUZ6_TRIWF|nr:transcriptional repressor ILP1 [Tripterygium wilfordii]KAF5737854.1 PAX3- and PAX7-binding protein 1 [Tripterygium wilfordii]
MSNSRARNFRRRADDEEDTAAAASPAPSATTFSTARKSSSLKPKKLLSFADDEEDEQKDAAPPSRRSRPSSRLSKPSSSSSIASSAHKLTSSKERIAPTSSNVMPQAGTYTKEALLELQKNTRTLAAPSSRPPPPPPVDSSAEPKIILKGLLKPQAQEPQDVEETSDSEENRGDVEGRLGRMGIGKVGDSGIPDEETIKAIRAKRERMRQARGAAPDYIALDSGSNHGAAEGLSDEEPEFRTRIAMIGTKKKGVFGDVDDVGNERGIDIGPIKQTHEVVAGNDFHHDVDDGDEDEESLWVEEQVRKGLGKRMDDGSASRVVYDSSRTSAPTIVPGVQQQQSFVYARASLPGIGGTFGGPQGLDGMSMSQQGEIAKKALQDNITRLKESHCRTVSSLTKTDENLSDSLLNITALEKSLAAAGEKFIFMQKLRDFVSVICEFLQHKAPFIEELEEQMQKLHEDRASANLERRTAENDDEMLEVETAVKAAMLVFSERGGSSAMIAAATSAAQAAAASVREQTNLPVMLDEFGRDMNLQKRMDTTRRTEARQRRKGRFDAKRLSSMEVENCSQKIEGESSTDESDDESTAYQSNRDLLLQTADQVFSDASEEYSQLSVVKQRFEMWKKDYSSTYRDAYMSLSVPAIFSPYVRLELLKWDPLHEDADFFDMKWHSLLFDYGTPVDGSDFTPDDADANLIPGLVEKVALPILHHEIVHCWDMLSTRETRNAVSATSLLTNYVPASSEAVAELLGAICTRLAVAVANIMVPTWSPLVLKAVPSAARVAAYRFGMSVRLMKNICLWKDILALPVLEKLALDELLCGKVLPHVRSIAPNIHDAISRTERLVDSLSGVWSGPSVTGSRSGKLQPLVEYVLSLGRALEKRHVSGVTENETGGLARRLKKILVELNEYDKARDIARNFHLKEAL